MDDNDYLSDKEREQIYLDNLDAIELGLKKNSAKWNLKSITWMDYDDVCQHIRRHIWKKIYQWNPERNFSPWVNTLIGRQIINIIRDNYGNFAKPCDKNCPFNVGNGHCSKTTSKVQDEECPDYANWKKRKGRAFDVKLPLPMDEGLCGGSVEAMAEIDYETSAAKLHERIKSKLIPKHAEIYFLLYEQGKSEEEVAEIYGYQKEKNRKGKVRYKQITNLKNQFVKIAKDILDEEDIV